MSISKKVDGETWASQRSSAKEMQRALWQRPSLSIRVRLGFSFALWFLVSLGITLTSIVLTTRIDDKLQFLEAAESYLVEIHQARRFEKNFFLYGTDLGEAIEQVRKARRILEGGRLGLEAVVGTTKIDVMDDHLRQYENLLNGLKHVNPHTEQVREILDHSETQLRKHGALMVTSAEVLVTTERHAVNALITLSSRIPIAFLVVLILLAADLSVFIARQVLAPLNRLMAATRRIAEGDFTPIVPRRKYHDELSELALALNHMMQELVQRTGLLVKAHKLKAVGTLTAGVAHELNNPINNIMLTACLLEEDYDDFTDEERIDMIRDLVSESERARKIVRNLLDFARETDSDAQFVVIQDLIDETIQLANNQIKLAKIKVKCKVESDVPPVFGDVQQLKQVFLNLVLNAVDAISDGGKITISADTCRDRDVVSIRITDTGRGIPEHWLDDIFDPFFTKGKTKGTGLGLSVSLGIVKKHGGDIEAESEIGKGTTFTILLPAAQVPADLSNSASST